MSRSAARRRGRGRDASGAAPAHVNPAAVTQRLRAPVAPHVDPVDPPPIPRRPWALSCHPETPNDRPRSRCWHPASPFSGRGTDAGTQHRLRARFAADSRARNRVRGGRGADSGSQHRASSTPRSRCRVPGSRLPRPRGRCWVPGSGLRRAVGPMLGPRITPTPARAVISVANIRSAASPGPV